MMVHEIPTLDRAELRDGSATGALYEACSQWGFFRLSGHGLDAALVSDLRAQMRALFALPQPAKESIARSAENPWGYFDRELTKNRRDWKEIYDVGPASGAEQPQWPESLPGFRNLIERYSRCAREIGAELVGAIAVALGAQPAVLQQAFADDTSFLRLNYYPPCADPAAADVPGLPESGHLGIHEHTDAGAVTLLLVDDQPGLQVFRNGRWHLLAPDPQALVINVGDVVQVWSNDRFAAPLHRVLAQVRAPRYSAAFFYNPGYDADYAPLPEVCSASRPPRYRSINWGQFRAGRAAGDYADDGEEIQIAHYRV